MGNLLELAGIKNDSDKDIVFLFNMTKKIEG